MHDTAYACKSMLMKFAACVDKIIYFPKDRWKQIRYKVVYNFRMLCFFKASMKSKRIFLWKTEYNSYYITDDQAVIPGFLLTDNNTNKLFIIYL